jgi:hypothetical protein
MLNTNWSYAELVETPCDLVDERMLIDSVKAEYQAAKTKAE